jgi:DNA polymerase
MIHLDFETYSEAGTVFNLETGRFSAPPGVAKRGIGLTGAYAYAAHPSADILCASYTLDHGKTINTWKPGPPDDRRLVNAPSDLSEAVIDGSLVYAFNSFFEWCVWNLVAVRRYRWPMLPLSQTRDVAAAALAWSLPGSLEMSSAALFGTTRKDTDGKRIMLKFSQPRNPTKNDKRLKFAPDYFKTASEAEGWHKLYSYCEQDVRAEIAVHDAVPELSPFELEVWKLDQKINARGVAVDLETVRGCIKVVEEGRRRAGLRLAELTNGAVDAVSKAGALLDWVNIKGGGYGLKPLSDLRPENIKKYLKDRIDVLFPETCEALKLRLAFGGNAVSKLYAMLYRSEPDGRVRGAFQYCGAQRTRRWAGRGLQTQNMPRGDVELWKCGFCGELTKPETKTCTRCRATEFKKQEWGIDSVEITLPAVQSGEYDTVNILWGNPNKIVSGCLRSMLTAASGHELISSDYSAIEAVVMACLAGESWIIETFFDDGKLYERTAAKITGETPETIIGYKNEHGKHHPARRLGKVASLASQ